MKIVADENISQVKEAFSGIGKVILTDSRKITRELLLDSDVLLIRSVTRVNENLLYNNSKTKFIGTATIGTDHVDINYLKKNNIFFADSAGCNAYSVAEYVICAVSNLFIMNKLSFENKTFAIVGYGNIGTKVASFAKALGFNILINDPPLQRITGRTDFCSLDEVLSADIITFHVPLNKSGIDKTYHLLNESNLRNIKSGTVLINTSRGPVIDNQILKKRMSKKGDLLTVLDVWENEPNIDNELLSLANISTAHIAGYSLEGKLNGTLMIYQKFCEHQKIESIWDPIYPTIENQSILVNCDKSIEEILNEICNKIYDINSDSELLKACKDFEENKRTKHFDSLRRNYRTRREFNNYRIKLNKSDHKIKNKLEKLRFSII